MTGPALKLLEESAGESDAAGAEARAALEAPVGG
jgi:hypothetical protein